MKTILICPAKRDGVSGLAEAMPLVNVPFLGKPFIAYWIEHLLKLGARQFLVLAADRPEQVRALVGDGSRWGVEVEVLPRGWEPTPEEVRTTYGTGAQTGWLAAPHDAVLLDHLPGLPQRRLFDSYGDWFAALGAWLPQAITPDRIGWREIQPGVFVGLHPHIASTARLLAPCWVGDDVVIGPEAVIGPMAILEDRAWVDCGARISRSFVGPETYTGRLTELRECLAWGGRLINWKTGLSLEVPDEFLLASLRREQADCRPVPWPARVLALLVLAATAPFTLPAILRSRRAGERPLQRLVAVRPVFSGSPMPRRTCIYHRLAQAGGWLRRWPQLWNIARGEFAWVGNRPLSPEQAARLATEFERLWLAAPTGLLSLADVEGCADQFNDDARAHASYYAVSANWRLDLRILWRGLARLTTGFIGQGRRPAWSPSFVDSELKNQT